jgi:hypothetical protein
MKKFGAGLAQLVASGLKVSSLYNGHRDYCGTGFWIDK